MKLDHVNIKAPMDLLERERDFFCDVLGLREGDRPDFGVRGFWLYAGDDPVVHLSETDTRAEDAGQGPVDHFAFRSSGHDRLLQVLADRGIEYKTFYTAELSMTQVFFRSPSGAKIEVNFPNEKL